MASELILPDSRLQDRSQGTFMADWPLPDGTTVRIDVMPIYCANCGKPYAYVPRENTTFICWLCVKCFETYGAVTGTYAVPEDEFNRAVAYEMERRYGRHLTDQELALQAEEGTLGTSLELLARESPYPSLDRRPGGVP